MGREKAKSIDTHFRHAYDLVLTFVEGYSSRMYSPRRSRLLDMSSLIHEAHGAAIEVAAKHRPHLTPEALEGIETSRGMASEKVSLKT